MDEKIYSLAMDNIDNLTPQNKIQAIDALESGKVVFLPDFFMALNEPEQAVLSESILNPKRKNISYDYQTRRLAGVVSENQPGGLSELLQQFMHRYAEFSKRLVDSIFPSYQKDLLWGRTSYRPAEVKGRKTSKLKDDTRLHVDSFPSMPVNGHRILRVFCNINPNGLPRVWHLGEPFSKVAEKFIPHIPQYAPYKARLLKLFKMTKSLRTSYDHHMLNLHNRMKLDDSYQSTVNKTQFDFPAYSTWLVYTDQASHAALSGQFLLEQTFYLPVYAMQHQDLSPLKQLEKIKSQCMA